MPGALDGSEQALAEVELVRLYPRWAPLLAGRLELARVRVEGLRLYLIRDGQGRVNWDTGQVGPGAIDGREPGTRTLEPDKAIAVAGPLRRLGPPRLILPSIGLLSAGLSSRMPE